MPFDDGRGRRGRYAHLEKQSLSSTSSRPACWLGPFLLLFHPNDSFVSSFHRPLSHDSHSCCHHAHVRSLPPTACAATLPAGAPTACRCTRYLWRQQLPALLQHPLPTAITSASTAATPDSTTIDAARRSHRYSNSHLALSTVSPEQSPMLSSDDNH